MPQRTDTFELGRLGLTSGEGRRLDLHAAIAPFDYGGRRYEVRPELVPVRLDVSRTAGSGWALRLRFQAGIEGPCMRCLDRAQLSFEVDAREVSMPGGGEELESPYVGDESELDLQAWARDALALALPAQLTCRPDCAGLCPQCGANLNDDPGHRHEAEPDPRWAKLSEIHFD
ncbi:MAG: YceD family protein [Solirubrobacteraceae bacterium]